MFTKKGRNKSYVIRSGRMTKLQERSLEELFPLYGIPFSEKELDYSRIFERDRPVILEIGFGMGEATVEIAEGFRNYNFIGIEVHPPGVGKVLHEARRRELDNLRVVQYDAVSVIETMIPDASLEGVHIFFPDPWPKKKHHKRRILNRDFSCLLSQKISPGGYLYVTTDWEDYAWSIVHTLSGIPELENEYEIFAPTQLWRPKTSFEKKGLRKNHLIREILFRKKG
ncbi:MAG: tRNA (guanosine(46)-N7)-methyltransferase TrmB [Spirochaetia bacterium]